MLQKRTIFSMVMLTILALIVIPSTFAATQFGWLGSISIASCNTTTVWLNVNTVATLEPGESRIERGGINGTQTFGFTTTTNVNAGLWSIPGVAAAPYPYTFYSEEVLIVAGVEVMIWRLEGTCTGLNTGTVTYSCILGCAAASSGEGLVQIFTDGRINSYDTGNSVVLFGKPDEDDAWRLEVYNADQTGMLFVVYPDAIAAVAECPESNTLIQSDEATGISLWRLTERTVTAEGVHVCPFQLNAPSTEAGKTYVIIFDTLFPNSYYESGDEWIGN
jgi:hypothetical protein